LFIFGEFFLKIFYPQPTGSSNWNFDKRLGLIPHKNQKGKREIPGIYSYNFTHNSWGFRGKKEYSPEKDVDLRILFLGDSFTYGQGVNDEDTFVHLTEKNLTSDTFSVEAINAGNQGKGTDYALRAFQIYGPTFKPDFTVLVFFSNDFSDNFQSNYFTVDLANNALTPKIQSDVLEYKSSFLFTIPGLFPAYNWLISWSHLANLFKMNFIRILRQITQKSKQTSSGDPNVNPEKMSEFTQIYIDHLIKETDRQKSKLFIFYIPTLPELKRTKETDARSFHEKKLQKIVKTYNLNLFSLTDPFLKSNEPIEDFYFVDDGHFTILGNKRAADYISQQLGYSATDLQKNRREGYRTPDPIHVKYQD